MKNLYVIHDFESVNGMFLNSINTKLFKDYFDYNFEFTKEVYDSIKITNNVDSISSENIFFENITPIHISNLDNHSLSKSNNFFIYPISLSGDNNLAYGLKNQYDKSEPFFNFVSEKWKNVLDNYKNSCIMIYCGLEHEMPFEYLKKIYVSLQNNNINPNKVYFISNNFSSYDTNKKLLNKLGINPSKRLNFFTYYEQLKTKSNEIIDENVKNMFISESEFDSCNKNKKSLILNRRLHLHRKIFLSLIMYDNIFDSNLISFDFDFEKNRVGDFKQEIYTDRYVDFNFLINKSNVQEYLFNNSIKNKILLGYSKLKEKNKNLLDVDNFNGIDGRELEIDDKNLYKETCFSVITETEMFSNHDRYITEKTIKPIQQLHPFIILGPSGTLEYLKKLGFKTFDKWWDESYDLEENSSKRLIMVYNLFKQLNDKSFDEWNKIYKEMKKILIYNRDNLKKYSYKNENIVFDNLKKYLTNEHIQENPKLLQTP